MKKDSGLHVYFILVALLLFIWFNFAINIFVGRNGILAGSRLKQEISAMESELKVMILEQKQLEDKVRRLKKASLDKDFLDEQAKLTIGRGLD